MNGVVARSNKAIALSESLVRLWKRYCTQKSSADFAEFSACASDLAEVVLEMDQSILSGLSNKLVKTCDQYVNTSEGHPSNDEPCSEITRLLRIVLLELKRCETPALLNRRGQVAEGLQWSRSRNVLIVCDEGHPWGASLISQLHSYGFFATVVNWSTYSEIRKTPVAIVFIPEAAGEFPPEKLEVISALRTRFSLAQMCCLGVPTTIRDIVRLQRVGVNTCLPDDGNRLGDVLTKILETIHSHEQQTAKVLLVEDSRTAAKVIQKSLAQFGIESEVIDDPCDILDAASRYTPDLVLMDMYMPEINGVEATRALRQMQEYQAIPIVYLSSETDVEMQVEALRLGGDQFLTKPANPVLLAAVVRTKIDRYREAMRSSQHDGLTGLLNHSASKARLSKMVRQLGEENPISLAMIDIDKFKTINDTYGHPVGDQVIRSLAWLLGARLRTGDLIGRYGGEEFIVAMPGAKLEDATKMLDRIRAAFEKLPHPYSGGLFYATLSCGLTSSHGHASSEEMIKTADDALLEAKANGRNRVVSSVEKRESAQEVREIYSIR